MAHLTLVPPCRADCGLLAYDGTTRPARYAYRLIRFLTGQLSW